MSLRGHGYNVFVAGEPGTSRTETVRHFLHEFQDPTFVPEDLCYVHNFRDPDQPRLLRFPAGQGRKFREALERKQAQARSGSAHENGGGKNLHAHGPAANKRTFRRKSG